MRAKGHVTCFQSKETPPVCYINNAHPLHSLQIFRKESRVEKNQGEGGRGISSALGLATGSQGIVPLPSSVLIINLSFTYLTINFVKTAEEGERQS